MQLAETKLLQIEDVLRAHQFLKEVVLHTPLQKTTICRRNTRLISILNVKIFNMFAHLN